ncbi:uncharacterized protein ATC70_002696 [Mucor velutinosus]|uniref:Uncharacterized protein n=1 Tax=Mucor velutinosus TaxID=708070 RepID=A0AAN7DCS7_9FUNG|nr:hypothetical protein ATC70_002696 [Mucor velutinosus]
MTFPTAINLQKTVQQDAALIQKVLQQIRPELIKAASATTPKAAVSASSSRWGSIENKNIAMNQNPAVVFDSLLQKSASITCKERNRFDDAIM